MGLIKLAYNRLKALFTPDTVQHDMDREMRLHLDLLADEYERGGMSPENARRTARRRFGNLSHIKDRGHDIRGAGILEDLKRDIHYAGRMLLRSPLFSAVIVLSLAGGIGANTALFSVFDAVFLRDLPVRNPEARVAFGWGSGPSPKAFIPARVGFITSRGTGQSGAEIRTVYGAQFSSLVVEKLRQVNDTLTDLAAFAPVNTDASIDNQPREVTAQVVSGNYFRTVGVTAIAGRTITPDDDRASAQPVVVISYDFWRRQFALDTAAIGKQITLSGVLTATIIGVTAPGFQIGWGFSPDFSIPMAFIPQLASDLVQPDNWILGMVGRMKPGIDVEQVRRNLEGIFVGTALDGVANTAAQGRPRLSAISGSQGFSRDYVIASIGPDGSYR